MKTFISVFTAMLCSLILAPESVAQNPTISGKWHFVLQTEDGERIADPTFQQDGDKVTGKWGDAAVKGSFTDGKLDLAFPYTSDEVGQGTLKIKGELKTGTLSGTWEFQEYRGSFKATRSSST